MIAIPVFLEPVPSRFLGNWSGTIRSVIERRGKRIYSTAKLEIQMKSRSISVKRWFPDGKDFEIYTSTALQSKKPSYRDRAITFYYTGVEQKDAKASEAGDFEISDLKLTKGVLTGRIFDQPFSLKQTKK